MPTTRELIATRLYHDRDPVPEAVDLLVGTESLDDMKAVYRQLLNRDDDFELLPLPEETGGNRDPRQELIRSALASASNNALVIRRTVHSYPELVTVMAESPIFNALTGRVRDVYHVRLKPAKQDYPHARNERRLLCPVHRKNSTT